jgi:hypothetical protein
MTIDPNTGMVQGGASFAASFGPGKRSSDTSPRSSLSWLGRYRAYVCATFKGEGYDLGKPTEYGVWLNNFPVKGLTDVQQVYYGAFLLLLASRLAN